MKLKRLRIQNQYRSLEPGFEINFCPDLKATNVDPVCMVGPNGSGKSNILEALTDIFYYLDCYNLNYTSKQYFIDPIGPFEIEYYLPINQLNSARPNYFNYKHSEGYHLIIITKGVKALPKFKLKLNNQANSDLFGNNLSDFIDIPPEDQKFALPRKIIAYSSGQNEILSLPYIKMDLFYLNEIDKNIKNKSSKTIEDNRLHYIDSQTCSAILISNFVMFSKTGENTEINKLKVFYEQFGFKSLTSFSFKIKYKSVVKNKIISLYEIARIINFLKKNLVEGSYKEQEDDGIEFFIDTQQKQNIAAFREVFIDAMGLYRFFERLTLANRLSIARHRRDKILNSKNPFSPHSYLSVEPADKQLFSITSIYLKIKGATETIHYKEISDGEYQALTIIGLLNMLDDSGNLILLDEPETHLNPKWKYNFINTLNKVCTQTQNQIMITTHDPIFVSGLKKENVILFRKMQHNIKSSSRWKFADKDLKGMGVDAILKSDVFGFQNTVDYETSKLILERRELLYQEKLTNSEQERLNELSEILRNIDYVNPFFDPLFEEFYSRLNNKDIFIRNELSNDEKEKRDKNAEELFNEIISEKNNETY